MTNSSIHLKVREMSYTFFYLDERKFVFIFQFNSSKCKQNSCHKKNCMTSNSTKLIGRQKIHEYMPSVFFYEPCDYLMTQL